MTDDREEIRKLYIRYWQYMIDKDVSGLESIQSDDYCLYHMTGLKQSREEFLKGLLNGTFNYYSAVHDDIEVSINGEEAVMRGKSRVVAAVYGGSRGSWRLQGDFSLRKEDGKWKFTSSRASTY